jgi:sugar phosphate permease
MAGTNKTSPSPAPSLSKEAGAEVKYEHGDRELGSGNAAVTDFGGDSSLPPPPTLSLEEERRLYRKLDIRLMPILSLMYLFSFLDRGNIGNAKLQGLLTQLDLTGNRFNIALTMYFIPYCIFECPANLVLKRFRPSRWLPGITIVWGVIMLDHRLSRSFYVIDKTSLTGL